jgi:hypothetical protein
MTYQIVKTYFLTNKGTGTCLTRHSTSHLQQRGFNTALIWPKSNSSPGRATDFDQCSSSLTELSLFCLLVKRIVFNMGTTKKIILFPASDRLLENVATGNIFWVIWRRLFKKSWLEVSESVAEFTFGTGIHCFVWSKSVARPGHQINRVGMGDTVYM